MIIILNGVPRSGKSSIAREIQATYEGLWINLGVDHSMATTPKHLLPGIGLRPGGERPDLEPSVKLLYQAVFESITAHDRVGLNVVVDLGIHDDYSQSLGIWDEMEQHLRGVDKLVVGVRCSLEEIRRRREETGMPAPVEMLQKWDRAVHHDRSYEVEVDTGKMSSEECATIIRETFMTVKALRSL